MKTWILYADQFPQVALFIVALFGVIVGNFLNICILNIPEGKSVLKAVSPWAKDRGWRFSVRHVGIQILTSVLFCLCYSRFDPGNALIAMGFTSILIAASFIDYDHLEIPDRFSVGGALLGVVLSTWHPELHGIVNNPSSSITPEGLGLIESMTGMLMGAGIFYWVVALGRIVFQKEAMGEGDVKLAACIGSFCGWQGAAFSLVAGAAVGLLLFPVMAIASKSKNWKMAEEGEEEPEGFGMPFGPSIAIAGWLYFMGLDFGLLGYFSP